MERPATMRTKKVVMVKTKLRFMLFRCVGDSAMNALLTTRIGQPQRQGACKSAKKAAQSRSFEVTTVWSSEELCHNGGRK